MTHQATIRGIGMSVGTGGVGAPAVLLEARGKLVPIFVDPGQAQSIEQGRQGIPAERPLTHDLFADVVDGLDGTLERVRIDALEDETFYAKLDLAVDRGSGEERLVRDARPSDGIALAVRVECPIIVADDVLDEAGRDPAELAQRPAETGSGGPLGAGMHTGPGTPSTDVEAGEAPESMDLDEGIEIDIDESDDPDADGDDDSAAETKDDVNDSDQRGDHDTDPAG